MTESYFPFDAGAGSAITENQWRKMASLFAQSGPVSGELNQLEVFADSSGRQVKVKSGKAFIQGHYYETDAQLTIAIDTAHATLPRIDRIVVRADFVNNIITVTKINGVAAGSPSPPSLTQSTSIWEISLAQVRVNAAVGTLEADKVTDERSLVSSSPIPPGAVTAFAGGTLPAGGWLLCNGQTVSRATYAALFAAIGTVYGVGDGSTTFSVPDYRNRFPVGQGTGYTGTDALGETGGAQSHVLTSSEMPSHGHSTQNHGHSLQYGSDTAGSIYDMTLGTRFIIGGDAAAIGQTNVVVNAAGGGGGHNNMPPYITQNFLIKT